MSQAKYSYKSPTDKLGFGVYRDLTIEDVLKQDPKYISWCEKNVKGFKIYKSLKKYFYEHGYDIK